MENENPDINKVKEAYAAYADSGRIRIFTSFSESQQEQYIHWSALSPEERLSEFFTIMARFYVFNKPVWKGAKIEFDL